MTRQFPFSEKWPSGFDSPFLPGSQPLQVLNSLENQGLISNIVYEIMAGVRGGKGGVKVVDVFLLLIFIIGIYYILRYRFNLKKAAETSKDALYPKSKEEFSSILLPGEWLEMEPLTKDSKSYKVVKWGTYASMILLILLLGAVLATDWLDSRSFLRFISFLLSSALSSIEETFLYCRRALS